MTEIKPRLSKLQNALEDIEAAGDAARLQLHLLSMQARERAGELGASVESLEERLDRGIEHAMQTAAAKTRELTSTVREFLGNSDWQPSFGLQARTLMSPTLHTCSASDSLNFAAQLMWDHDCGVVPVVEANGRLCGIITDRDICMAAYTQGKPLADVRVGEIMSRPVHVCHPQDSLDEVATIMAGAQVRRVPVVDIDGCPLGVVSLSNIALAASAAGKREGQAIVFRLLQAISKPRREPVTLASAAE
jgi:CBS domain-containing protein